MSDDSQFTGLPYVREHLFKQMTDFISWKRVRRVPHFQNEVKTTYGNACIMGFPFKFQLARRTVAPQSDWFLYFYCYSVLFCGVLGVDRKRQARAFHRMLTGLQIAQNNRAFMRFMTLTSVKYPKYELKDGFDVLRLRIQRARYERDGFHGFKFNRYFCIRTSEGNGVLHIVFWGRFIPQDWLRRQWMDINGAFKADIRKVTDEKRRVGGLVGYLITNYLTEQPIQRMSYGWRWAWLGFCKSWKRVQETYNNLRRWRIPYKQGAAATWHDKYKDCSWEAWWSFLWGDRITSVQKKLVKGLGKHQLALVIYGLPRRRLVWTRQTTLFGFNHGFAT